MQGWEIATRAGLCASCPQRVYKAGDRIWVVRGDSWVQFYCGICGHAFEECRAPKPAEKSPVADPTAYRTARPDPQLFTLDTDRDCYVDDSGKTYPRVSRILSAGGLRPSFSTIHPDRLARKAEFGNQVHQATQFLDEGTLDWDTVPEEVQPCVWAWERFKLEHEYEVTDIEQIVGDRVHLFAGRYDRLGWRRYQGRRRRSLVDIKTGIVKGAKYATAAYVKGHLAMHPEDHPLIERLCVVLLPTAEYRLDGPYEDPKNFTIFLAACALYHERANEGLLQPVTDEDDDVTIISTATLP
jgi:hypothetical protein